MSNPNIGDMMKQAQQVQARFGELQRELATRRFEASSGGGMVKAIVSGPLRVLGVEIEPSLVSDGDREMIQDLCAAAVNAALERAQQGVQEEFQKLQSSMVIPGAGGGAEPR
jgi:DNA-binding YbaB/EbfC family protein